MCIRDRGRSATPSSILQWLPNACGRQRRRARTSARREASATSSASTFPLPRHTLFGTGPLPKKGHRDCPSETPPFVGEVPTAQ
eukprot:7176881-Alexandrium_andersonii.AAC.1